MNWKYDHLRHVPRHRLVVLADEVMNRAEFPDMEAREWNARNLPRRIWRRLAAERLYPADARLMRRLAPRVLHSHFGYVAVRDHALHTALATPWVVSFYGADVFELTRQQDILDRYAAVFATARSVLALGPFMAESLHALGCPLHKIRVHPLGVDLDDLPYHPRARQPGEPLKILFAGTFREKKGVLYLLRAVSLLRAEGHTLELHLVGDAANKPGDNEHKREIHRLIGNLDLESTVTIRPFLPFRDVVELALSCHVLAAPSVTAENGDAEGTPFIIQQMMGTGMPVVSTRHSDIPFIFGDLADRLVPERDAHALAAALHVYAADTEAAVRDAPLFRSHVEAHLDIRVHAAALADLYDELIV
jgi:colanic acid/amylovoran biosynthesis glycosyltransferase